MSFPQLDGEEIETEWFGGRLDTTESGRQQIKDSRSDFLTQHRGRRLGPR